MSLKQVPPCIFRPHARLLLFTARPGGLHRSAYGRPGFVHVLQVTGPATYAAADTTAAYAAVQAFTRHVGPPHALLYLSTTGGRPDKDRCLRVVQDLQQPTPSGPTLEALAQGMKQEGTGLRFLQPADSALLQPALDLLHQVRQLK